MTWFLLGIVALIGFYFFMNWLSRAQPGQVVRTLKWGAIGIGGGILLIVVLTKNFYLIWGLGAMLLPWIMRLRSLRQMWKSMKGPSAGQRSEISSRFFDMHLDHDTGAMDGRVKEGSYVGALLSELALEEAQTLHGQIREAGDQRSLQLLEAYLDRLYGSTWRDPEARQEESRNHDSSGPMTEAEALSLLGLQRDATPEAIKAAHRRLMKQVHPDTGGSAYLAAKVNEAKDLLLKSL